MQQSHIRNFCIIAHIDHGKSTLADRLLEITGTVEKRKMREQLLDQMDLERERGITIKLAPALMQWKYAIRNEQNTNKTQLGNRTIQNEEVFALNLIDTPGHADFTYEVSRSLAAVEGAILLVDASQGVQAQTIANLYLALEQNLTIIPVINKIDLPNADVPRVREEIVNLVGCSADDILLASGKTGEGVPEILEAIVTRVPPPPGVLDSPLRALAFDSTYDDFRGVVAFVRVADGMVKRGDRVVLLATSTECEALEVGCFKPERVARETIAAGEIGYIVTGLKDIARVRVGDTVTNVQDYKLPKFQIEPLPGYREVKPMVFAGIFPKDGGDFSRLREAMLKLRLSDASLTFEPEHSGALGFGYRAGFLGLLHLEIIQERLRREHKLDIVATTPSVAYRVTLIGGAEVIVRSPHEFPEPPRIATVREPWVALDIVTPTTYVGPVMQLAAEKRAVYRTTEYLGAAGPASRAILKFDIPLSSILVEFYDALKGATAGYASMNYELAEYREADIVKLDILVAEDASEALAVLLPRDDAQRVGRTMVERLKSAIPREQFEIKLQAALGGKVVASERISALRKDVLAKMSGGDVSRKMKLLEKQKKGKKRMKHKGSVDIPAAAYLAVLKR